MARQHKPLHLILDFDGTITVEDTISALVRGVCDIQKERGKEHTPLREIVEAYLRDDAEYVAAYQPTQALRHTPEEEIAFLNGRKDIEERSYQRACDGRIFDNIDEADIRRIAEAAVQNRRLALRPRWQDVFLDAHRSDTPVTFISVNWSAAFIRRNLISAALLDTDKSRTASEKQLLVQLINAVHIYANELPDVTVSHPELDHASSGRSSTSGDKLRCLQRVMEDSHSFVYIGDSPTDLECLLTARTGIVAGARSSLAETLDRLNINVLPLEQYKADEDTVQPAARLWSIETPGEVTQWLVDTSDLDCT